MKLYFYILDTYGESPKGLCVKECEAEIDELERKFCLFEIED